MKKKIKYFAPLIIAALFCVFYAKWGVKKKIVKVTAHAYFYATTEKPFVVVIPSYNNEEICERNILSVINQKYKNYRVIYIDDCSKDKTFEKVKQVVAAHGEENRFLIQRNEKNRGALENLYRAIHSCKDEEIVVILDGDDFLASDWVLEKLNGYYANPGIWLTYGSYVSYPMYTPGECSRSIPSNVFRKISLRDYCSTHGMITSHLRTFYAGLFKKIKLEDFFYKGNFFDSTYDGAMMFPMIEMATKDHIFFTREILYVYNRANPLNDDKVNFEKQQRCWRHILSMPPYKALDRLNLVRGEQETCKTDLVVFSYDRPMQLYAFLESLEHYTKNVNKVSVIYRAGRGEYEKGYEDVKRAFPETNFVKQGDEPQNDFKPLVLKEVFADGSSDYITFAVDDVIIKDAIDFNAGIQAVKERQAYGFYYRLGKHVDYCYMEDIKQGIPFMISLDNHINAWRFSEGRGDWKYPNSLDMTLYKKTEIEKDLKELDYTNPNSLEGKWAARAHYLKVGLCYDTSKIVNLPLGLVNISSNRNMNRHSAEELLTFFNQGLKIDIAPLHQIENRSAHIEHHPIFVDRAKR